MFDFNQPLLLAGWLLGFASSLHCFGMCSGIAASLQFATTAKTDSAAAQLSSALSINAGRIAGYVVAGALVGGVGSGVFGALDRSLMNGVLRWAGAMSLGWIGLSMLNVVPLPAGLYRIGAIVSEAMQTASRSVRLPRPAAAFAAGAAWGFLPCAMVYATLFYAMLSGSAPGGALVMLGFGLGTLPALLAAGFGVAGLRHRFGSQGLQTTVGLGLLLLGVSSIALPPGAIAAFCGFG